MLVTATAHLPGYIEFRDDPVLLQLRHTQTACKDRGFPCDGDSQSNLKVLITSDYGKCLKVYV